MLDNMKSMMGGKSKTKEKLAQVAGQRAEAEAGGLPYLPLQLLHVEHPP